MITECWTPQSNCGDTFFSIYLVLNVRVIEQKGISYLNADLPTHFLLVINFVDTITFCTTNNLIRYIIIVKCPL